MVFCTGAGVGVDGVSSGMGGEQPKYDKDARKITAHTALEMLAAPLIVVKKVCILNLCFTLHCNKQDTVFHALVSSRSYP